LTSFLAFNNKKLNSAKFFSDMYIGMSAADLPNDHHIGNWADAFAINHHGRLYVGGKHTSNIGPFAKNDVIGCGLLLLATGCRRIFFTKNGKLSSKKKY
jgi:hypothetical protein